jgi:ATP-dependent helicase/nuclease subunit B
LKRSYDIIDKNTNRETPLSVELLIGPPGSGKTEHCINKIQTLKAQQPLSHIWVLVPDSHNRAYFQRRLAKSGGAMGINVGTFSALFSDILEGNGVFTPVIPPALEHRLVAETIDQAYENGQLAHYAAIKRKPGFIHAMGNVFSEMRSAYVSPQQFLTYTKDAPPARRELALLYQGFLQRLDALNWIDRDGQIWNAIDLLQRDPHAAAYIRLLIVDGFSAFAGARGQFLKSLSAQVGEVLITLPGAIGSNRPVHQGTSAEIEKLIALLSPQVTAIDTPPRLSPEIRHLEAHALDPGEHPRIKTSAPILLEGHAQSEEAREALRWIKTLVLREGFALGDCAVFAADLPTYRPLLRAAAAEFGVKTHFSHPDSLANSSLVASLLSLLELPIQDFGTRALFNVLHAPYFDFQLEPEDIGELETVSQHARIVIGRDQWQETWARLLKLEVAPNGDDLEDESRYKNPLAEINAAVLRARFSHFWKIFEDIEENRSLAEWITWLEDTLEALRFYDTISAERDQDACQALSDALKAMLLSEKVAGDRMVDYPGFVTDLQSTLTAARLDEPRAARKNAVYIGKMTEARASRFAAVVLMGFSEGIFPAVENPDPFLDEGARRDLGLEPRLGRDQVGTFYQAFTRAEKRLLLTRPYLSEDGESWEASPYWDSAQSLLDQNARQKISQNLRRPQCDAASSQELLFWAVQEGRLAYGADPELAARWQDLQAARDVLEARRAGLAAGPYEGDAAQIAGGLAAHYGVDHVWSASRLETYGSCPLHFYVQHVLKLEPKEPPELGLDPRQLGSMLHRVLELVYARAEDPSDVDQLLAGLEDTASQVFKSAPTVYGFRPSPLWEVEQAQFMAMLRETITALAEVSRGWTPIAFEEKFGIGSAPPLHLHLDDQVVLLHGLIDRVDQHASGELRVVDYKTGSSHLSDRDFIDGRRLQLPIYALAAQDALQLGPVTEGFYWVIKDAKASSFKLSKYQSDDQQGLSTAKALLGEHIQRSLRGIRAGNFAPSPPRGGCPSYCPAAGWCWRYQGGW